MLQKGIKSKVSNLENSRKNQHQNKKLSISITKAIKSQKTFILFTTSYIQYQIITRSQNINWKVKRRFNQFKWLHDILIQRYPYLPIPPIPPKTTMRSFDQLHIQDRRITFQKFLNKLIDSPELCSQSIVQDFLQIDNNQEFKKIKQEYQKYVQLTVNGKSDQIQTIYDDQQFQPKRIAINDQILDNYKIISELYGKIVGKTSEIDLSNQNLLKSYTQLSQLFSKLFEKQKLFKGNGLHHLVIQFLNQLKQWTMMTNNIVGKYVKDTYCYQQKYLQKYLSQMRRIRKHNNTISQKYKQIFQKYAQGQVPVLDPAENNKLSHSAKYFRQFQRQKQDYKIGLGNLLRQIQRYYEKGDMLKSHSKIWQNGLNVYMDGIRQNMVGGVDLLTKIMSLKEGKELIEVQYKKQYMKKVQKQKEKENMKEKENVSSYIVLDSMEQQLEQKK